MSSFSSVAKVIDTRYRRKIYLWKDIYGITMYYLDFLGVFTRDDVGTQMLGTFKDTTLLSLQYMIRL